MFRQQSNPTLRLLQFLTHRASENNFARPKIKSTFSKLPKAAALASTLALLLSAAHVQAQNNIGDVDDRTKAPGCYQSSGGWGVYTVKGGKSNSTDVHDPRCERKNLLPKIDTDLTLTFEATYRVDSADNTTIAQILNYDQNSSDKHKPVVFILARDRGSQWGIYDQGTELGRVSKDSVFSIKITSYSSGGKMFSDIYLNGVKESVKQHARVGSHSQMRYGNYHHGDGTAVIRVKDVSFGHGTGSSNPPPVSNPSPSNDYRCSTGATTISQAESKFSSVCSEFSRSDCDQRSLSGNNWWLCSSQNVDGNSVRNISSSSTTRIQAEDYHRADDFDAQNRGGAYRDSGVDIQATSDAGGGHNVGWIRNGESLTYDIAVSSAGNYTLELRTASPNDTGLIAAYINGGQRGTSKSIAYTGDYHQYSTISMPLGNLSVGFHELEIRIQNGGFNLNWLGLKKGSGSSTPTPPAPTPNPPTPDTGSCTNYSAGARQEIDLRSSNCVNFPSNLSQKTLQVWDSDTNASCNFRGSIRSVNGSGTINISSNYQSSSALSGTRIELNPSNGCQFVKLRVH